MVLQFAPVAVLVLLVVRLVQRLVVHCSMHHLLGHWSSDHLYLLLLWFACRA